MNFFAAFWERLSNTGTQYGRNDGERKRIILTNQITATIAIVPLLYMIQFRRHVELFAMCATVEVLILSVYLFLSVGGHKAARLLLVLFPTVFIMLVVSFFTTGEDLLQLIPGKLLILALISLPVTLFEWRDRAYLIAGVLIVMVCFFGIDWVASNTPNLAPDLAQNIVSRVYLASIIAIGVLVSTFSYLLRVNAKSEQRILGLYEDVSAKSAELEEALQDIQATQSQLIQSEKLATLGQLVAGIAHEINTPLGAINAASGSLNKVMPAVLYNYPKVYNTLDDELQRTYYQLVERSMASKQTLSSREERQYRKQLAEYLEANQVPGASDLAAQLVKAGILNNLEPFLPLFRDPRRDNVFEMVFTAGKIFMNIDNIQIASNKMQKIVLGLKSYSHRSGDHPEPVDVRDTMSTVLTIYHSQLKHGIDVIRNLEDVPVVLGYGDQLTQVWTNIIQNAIHAMKGQGTLTIDLRREGANVLVAITDTGPGIPVEVQPRIFEAFFTTKAKGEGTGLGLDICRNIVEKHHGTISVRSRPGETTFTILLPVAEGYSKAEDVPAILAGAQAAETAA